MVRVLYAGSPASSAKVLKTLVESAGESYCVVGALTNVPKRQGSHKALIQTPVAEIAKSLSLPVITTEHLDAECRRQIEALKSDLLVCFSYGRIFGPKFLALFSMGGINLHPSLLPKYRGPTPINAAILNGDKETALTVQRVTLQMDAGNILAQEVIPLDGTQTAGSLLDIAASKGGSLLAATVKKFCDCGAKMEGTPQMGPPSFTSFITKESAKLNFDKSAKAVDAFVRAYNPEPIAWFSAGGDVIRVLEGFVGDASDSVGYKKGRGIGVQCANGVFVITKLQKSGKRAMSADEFMNGVHGPLQWVKAEL